MAFNDSSASLLFKIKADGSDSRKEIKAVASEISNLVSIFTGDRLTGATSQITSFGNAITALPGPAGLAVGAVAGLTAVVASIGASAVGVGAALFELTKKASDFGSIIHDMAEQTGLSTKVISSLKVATEESGSSLEGVGRGIKQFTLLMGEAEKGSADAQLKLKALGVTSKDLDAAFGQVVKRIYQLPAGIQQNTAAADAFGRKLGAELIPLINQFHGDLPGLIAEMERLGATVSEQDSVAADEFGDQLVVLNTQLASVAHQIGFAFMPVFTDMAASVSAWLVQNKSEVREWADAESLGLYGVVGYWKDLNAEIAKYIDLRPIDKNEGVFGWIAAHSLPRLLAGRGEEERRATPIPGQLAGQVGGYTETAADEEAKKAAEKRRKEAAEARAKLLADQLQYLSVVENANQYTLDKISKQWTDSYKKGEISADEYHRALFALEEEFRKAGLAAIDQEYATKRAKAAISAKELAALAIQENTEKERLTSASLDREEKAEHLITEIKEQEAEKRKKIAEEENQAVIDIAREKTDTLIAQFELMKAKGIISEKQYAEIVGELHVRQLELERALTDEAQKRATIDQNIIQQKTQNAISGIEQTEKEKKALDDAAVAYDKYRQSVWEAMIQQAEFIAQQQTLADQMSLSGVIIQEIAKIINEAFQGMANAIGQVVEQWVLYGATGPSVMRKILASALATIAAEAAVRAIFALAYGFLMLALGDFYSAGQAFLAAAVFGTIAGVAALAGRAIAGNAFKQQTTIATGKPATSRSQGEPHGVTQYSSLKDTVAERSRNQPGMAGIPVNVTLSLKDDSTWLGRMLKADIDRNGPARRVILDLR